MIHFKNDTEKLRKCLNHNVLLYASSLSPTLDYMNNCLGHDLELGLCWSSRVEPSLSKQIPGWSDMYRLSSRLYQLNCAFQTVVCSF